MTGRVRMVIHSLNQMALGSYPSKAFARVIVTSQRRRQTS